MSAAGGALLGLVGGGGVLLAVSRLPVLRRPTLEDRLGPYLRDAPRVSRLLDAGPRTVTPFPTGTLRRRLDQAGGHLTLEQLRAQQVVCGGLGTAGGVLLLIVHASTGRGPGPVTGLLLTLLLALGGVAGRDWWLGRQVSARSAAIAAELPTVAELLALAVAAGEGPIGALERVASLTSGELAGELARALADARAGAPLQTALRGVAERTAVPAVARFVDGLSVAIERGTPLADVLRAQAVDAREAGRRALLEVAGKKEIAMLAPVVFLILPVVVLFRTFPSGRCRAARDGHLALFTSALQGSVFAHGHGDPQVA